MRNVCNCLLSHKRIQIKGLQCILDHLSPLVEQLRNGCKPLEVKHDRIRFIDSLSFFQMSLSAFPKTFGLTELRKGYFPHKFNIPEHQVYVGPVLALDYYMPETMSSKGR